MEPEATATCFCLSFSPLSHIPIPDATKLLGFRQSWLGVWGRHFHVIFTWVHVVFTWPCWFALTIAFAVGHFTWKSRDSMFSFFNRYPFSYSLLCMYHKTLFILFGLLCSLHRCQRGGTGGACPPCRRLVEEWLRTKGGGYRGGGLPPPVVIPSKSDYRQKAGGTGLAFLCFDLNLFMLRLAFHVIIMAYIMDFTECLRCTGSWLDLNQTSRLWGMDKGKSSAIHVLSIIIHGEQQIELQLYLEECRSLLANLKHQLVWVKSISEWQWVSYFLGTH